MIKNFRIWFLVGGIIIYIMGFTMHKFVFNLEGSQEELTRNLMSAGLLIAASAIILLLSQLLTKIIKK